MHKGLGREEVESFPGGQGKSKRLRLAKFAQTLIEKGGGRTSNDEVAEVVETCQVLNDSARESTTHSVVPDISTRHPNSVNHSESSFEENVQLKTRKKRGKTMMKTLSLTPGERAAVEFNEFGQPIGPNSKHLSSYLSTLARDMIPVNISGWKKVDDKLKEDLWTCIQTRFIVDEHYKSLLMMMLGHRWKEAKSRLISTIRAASKSPDATSRLVMLKPDNIKTAQEWIDFTKKKLSEEFGLNSKKFKKIRSKNKIPHTMSRCGYVRLAEELKKDHETGIDRDELWCKAHIRKNGEPPNSVVADCITKIKEYSNSKSSQGMVSLSEDGVAKVFSKERYGRIRGLGFGVSPTQLGVHMINSKKVSTLENKVAGLQNTVQESRELVMMSMAGRENLIADPIAPPVNTQSQALSQHGSTSVPNGHMQHLPKKCKLLNWQKKVVAEGTLASTDPTALVHHVPLGEGNWKVWVDVPVEPQAPLWRETSEACTIQQAIGTTVAWLKDFIVVD